MGNLGDTDFGFCWGPMLVERLAHIKDRGYCVQIRTEHQILQVYVSEKGRKITAMPVIRTQKSPRSTGAGPEA